MAKDNKDFDVVEFVATLMVFIPMVFLYDAMKRRLIWCALLGTGIIGCMLGYVLAHPDADNQKKGTGSTKTAVFNGVRPAPRADTVVWPTVARDRILHMMPTQRVK